MACTKKGKSPPKTEKKGSTRGRRCTSFKPKEVTYRSFKACRNGKTVAIPGGTRKQLICQDYG